MPGFQIKLQITETCGEWFEGRNRKSAEKKAIKEMEEKLKKAGIDWIDIDVDDVEDEEGNQLVFGGIEQ